MKRLTLLFFSFVLGFSSLFAQTEIVGNVTSQEDGTTLPGVSVVIKGTTSGVITDFDGNFAINVPGSETVLIFTFVGMKTLEVTVGDQTTINAALESDVFGLDEVVVTGYSTQRRATLTGAVSTVGSEELERVPASNIAQRMQGLVTGVTVVNSHTPGGGASILVRGLGTINNNDPLYVIDGVPTKHGMSQLNPNDVESITVLKDAASQAIYGARGANGVIIITTKKGSSAKPEITFNARTGTSKATGYYDLLNTEEYGQMLWMEADNDGIVGYSNQLYGSGSTPVIPDYILPAGLSEGDPLTNMDLYNIDESAGSLYLIMKANKEGTDWYDEMLQTAPMKEYDLSISGGTDLNSYFFSAGYMSEDGILKHTGFERYSVRSNADAQLADWLKVGQNLGVTFTEGHGNRGDNSEGTVISQGYRMQPIIPVYDEAGNWGGTKAPSTGNGQNPLAQLTRDQNDFGKDLRVIGNFFAEATVIDGLTFKSLAGYDYRAGFWKDIFIKNPEFSEAKPTDKLNIGNNYTLQWNWANTVNYNKTFGGVHNVNVLLGTEAVSSSYRWSEAGRTTYFSTDLDYMYLDAGESDQSNGGLGSEWTTFSYFGKLNYDLAGKYLLEATLRRDGSSRFGANERWAVFPAFSAGWRISEESFMAGTETWLDYMKVRAGWGQSGNDEVGNYNGFTTFRTSNAHSFYGFAGSNTASTAGFDSNAFGNPDARWETTSTTNLGIDANFLNNKLSVVFDVWTRNTTDMLYRLGVPSVIGQANIPSVNIGEMENKGFDLMLVHRGTSGDFRYSVSANISHYKNEIVKISDNPDEQLIGGALRQMSYTRAEQGTEFPQFFGYEVEGFFETQAEADAWPATFDTYNAPGHFKYKDINDDGVIDDEDRTYIGSPHPDFTAGLNLNLGYGPFELTAFFYGSYGNELVNYVRRWTDYTNFQGNRSYDRLYKSWGSPYLEGEPTLAIADNDQRSQEPSSHFVEDASFLRLKSLQLTYDMPQVVLNNLKMKSMQVYLQGTNLFTLTEYSGLDPEVRSSTGIDEGAWPTPRQLMIGVRIGI